jgi:hypothetical protein
VKPVLTVPKAGQYEQRLNAWDAERHGAARAGTYDDLDRFWNDKRPPSAGHVSEFRAWVARAPNTARRGARTRFPFRSRSRTLGRRLTRARAWQERGLGGSRRIGAVGTDGRGRPHS